MGRRHEEGGGGGERPGARSEHGELGRGSGDGTGGGEHDGDGSTAAGGRSIGGFRQLDAGAERWAFVSVRLYAPGRERLGLLWPDGDAGTCRSGAGTGGVL